MDKKEEIGRNIQYCRKHFNMTQRELAEKINKTESSIKKYEAGITQVPTPVLHEIAQAFDIDIKYLLGNENHLRWKLLLEGFVDKDMSMIDDSFIDYRTNNQSNENEIMNYFKNNFKFHNKLHFMVKESDSEYEVEDVSELNLNQDVLIESLSNLAAYANKCKVPNLTNRQQDILFDSVIDYIKFKLYSFDKE